jgi:hypothetical protein
LREYITIIYMSELIGDPEFEASIIDPQDIGAYALLVDRLGQKVGDVHPRLSQPNEDFTDSDEHVAALTYGEIVAREATSVSPELPEGAHNYNDPRSRLALANYHMARIDTYLNGGSTVNHPNELAGAPVIEFQNKYAASDSFEEHARWLHPEVEGYNWFRGLEVPTGEDSAIIIFTPWMQPWRQGGAPFPTLYAIGDPSPERVREIVSDYCSALFEEC